MTPNMAIMPFQSHVQNLYPPIERPKSTISAPDLTPISTPEP